MAHVVEVARSATIRNVDEEPSAASAEEEAQAVAAEVSALDQETQVSMAQRTLQGAMLETSPMAEAAAVPAVGTETSVEDEVAVEMEMKSAAELAVEADKVTRDTRLEASVDAAIAATDVEDRATTITSAVAAVAAADAATDDMQHVQRGSVRRLSMALAQRDVGHTDEQTQGRLPDSTATRRQSWQLVDGNWQKL